MTRWGAGVQLLFSPPRSRSCTEGGRRAQSEGGAEEGAVRNGGRGESHFETK